MNEYLSALDSIFDFIFTLIHNVSILYTTSFILMTVLGLWIIRKVVKLFKII